MTVAPVQWEEVDIGGTLWIRVRARGAEWSWLTPDDALKLGWDFIRNGKRQMMYVHLSLKDLRDLRNFLVDHFLECGQSWPLAHVAHMNAEIARRIPLGKEG